MMHGATNIKLNWSVWFLELDMEVGEDRTLALTMAHIQFLLLVFYVY
jgi:hypothetical protein